MYVLEFLLLILHAHEIILILIMVTFMPFGQLDKRSVEHYELGSIVTYTSPF